MLFFLSRIFLYSLCCSRAHCIIQAHLSFELIVVLLPYSPGNGIQRCMPSVNYYFLNFIFISVIKNLSVTIEYTFSFFVLCHYIFPQLVINTFIYFIYLHIFTFLSLLIQTCLEVSEIFNFAVSFSSIGISSIIHKAWLFFF